MLWQRHSEAHRHLLQGALCFPSLLLEHRYVYRRGQRVASLRPASCAARPMHPLPRHPVSSGWSSAARPAGGCCLSSLRAGRLPGTPAPSGQVCYNRSMLRGRGCGRWMLRPGPLPTCRRTKPPPAWRADYPPAELRSGNGSTRMRRSPGPAHPQEAIWRYVNLTENRIEPQDQVGNQRCFPARKWGGGPETGSNQGQRGEQIFGLLH